MKKFFQVCTSIKELTALCYTAAMCFYMFFLWVFKQEDASLSMLFSLLLVCMAAGTMQVAAFSDLLFKKLAYGWRLMVFVVPFGAGFTAPAGVCGRVPPRPAGGGGVFGGGGFPRPVVKKAGLGRGAVGVGGPLGGVSPRHSRDLRLVPHRSDGGVGDVRRVFCAHLCGYHRGH